MTEPTGFRVETIQFGQEVREVDGTQTIATADLVQVVMVMEGKALASGLLTPGQARVFAAQIAGAADKLDAPIPNPSPDAGRPVSPLLRFLGGF